GGRVEGRSARASDGVHHPSMRAAQSPDTHPASASIGGRLGRNIAAVHLGQDEIRVHRTPFGERVAEPLSRSDLIGWLVNATGWRVCDCLELTWADVADVAAYWKKHPPTQWLIEGYLRAQGYLGEPERQEMTDVELRSIATG
ncbi:MAG: hypothetical protein KGL35_27215, partial [Bradyrhizobium sp.]|nr:hypothetical protein [Bradyrhizobium sp.]